MKFVITINEQHPESLRMGLWLKDVLDDTQRDHPALVEFDAAMDRDCANARQPGGTHYKKLRIQPWDFIIQNEIPWLEGNAIVYLVRWRDKGGVEDLIKAQHLIEKRLETEKESKS